MLRKWILVIGVVVAISVVLAIGRLYVGIPFVPASGRQVVARLSGLPIPLFVRSEDAVDECSGMFCMDYYGRGLIRLSPDACAKAVLAAKAQGWRSLPLPADIDRVQVSGAPAVPRQGYFRFDGRPPKEQRFSWIDSMTCQLYAELYIS